MASGSVILLENERVSLQQQKEFAFGPWFHIWTLTFFFDPPPFFLAMTCLSNMSDNGC
ncbi:unnamed protein product [Periconia digitata]|uniref:Uncharacterized protein n=1 Tax=Periconia digitata TaxID=1303443 RepID=A0A9W4UFW9_9PLEO|nr:unnamed protein product [Periconia digitata]